MKAKKLTKHEWYEAAQFWGDFGDHRSFDEASTAEILARREFSELDSQYTYDDRICLYSQYCLERAGIPAGDQ